MKTCTKCKIKKETIDFCKDIHKKDGLSPRCRSCSKEYRLKNVDKLRAKRKEYVEKNKEYIREWMRNYHANNKEKWNKASREYYHNNREKCRKLQKEYCDLNRDKINKHQREYLKTERGRAVDKNKTHKRRAQKSKGDLTTEQILEVQRKAKKCYWCGCKIKNNKLHLDHYVPLSKGGEHTLSNIVVSCPKCNMNKNSKDPIEFANKIGKLF